MALLSLPRTLECPRSSNVCGVSSSGCDLVTVNVCQQGNEKKDIHQIYLPDHKRTVLVILPPLTEFLVSWDWDKSFADIRKTQNPSILP